MRILLIDILRTTLEEVWPSAEHSLGLMYLAAVLRQKFDGQIVTRVWTLISKPGHEEEERSAAWQELETWQPDIVGIRSLSIGKVSLRRLAETVREWNRNCTILAGGPYPTDDPGDVVLKSPVDYVVIGEGELTLVDLISRKVNGASCQDVPGIAYRANGGVLRTVPRPLLAELDGLPTPDYSVVELDRFTNRFLTFSSKIYRRHGNIMTTRGCPYKCLYCHNILGRRFRTRSPQSVLGEMRLLHDRYGMTDFQIIDDIFNLDGRRAKEICELIIQSGLKVTLSFPNGLRADRMDEELVDKLAAAGTKFISYAIETASPRLQKLICKNLDLDKVLKVIEYTAKAGIITRGFFMLGFPTETEAEARETIEYARASALCGATFFTVVYFPGTGLYRLAQSLGYFLNKGYEVQRDYVQTGEGPYEFGVDTLTDLKRRAIRQFAFTRERIGNALRLLPAYFTPREIDGFFMAYVVSSGLKAEQVEDEYVRRVLRRHFLVAQRFSKGGEFYV